MAENHDASLNHCSFCGRHSSATGMLVSGEKVAICESCNNKVISIFREEQKEKFRIDFSDILKPHEIKTFLDKYVIDQEYAKKILSVSVYNHYKRLRSNSSNSSDVELEKSNVLLIGETGTGKTLLARTIARCLKVPFAIADATTLTEAGYVGDDVENILTRLLAACDYNIKAAESGIVFIDEIDKIARKGESRSITRDVSGEGVQQSLLKIIEGSTVTVPPHGGRKHPEQRLLEVNTQNILFICSGAFNGIETIISSRLNTGSVGFATHSSDHTIDKGNLLRYVNPQDVRKFGLIPELVGRLPIIAHLDALDKSALLNILTQPQNAIIKQYVELLAMDEIELLFENEALEAIAEIAIKSKLGARGLRGICEAIMEDIMFDAPTSSRKKIQVTAQLVYKKLSYHDIEGLKYA